MGAGTLSPAGCPRPAGVLTDASCFTREHLGDCLLETSASESQAIMAENRINLNFLVLKM